MVPNDWIAERRLEAELPDGERRDIVVRIGRPEARDEEQEFWYCRFQVEGLEAPPYEHEVFGPGDSVNAVWYALVHAGLRLKAYKERGIRLTWFGAPGLGFPDANQRDS